LEENSIFYVVENTFINFDVEELNDILKSSKDIKLMF
jgi:hypothetical protein